MPNHAAAESFRKHHALHAACTPGMITTAQRSQRRTRLRRRACAGCFPAPPLYRLYLHRRGRAGRPGRLQARRGARMKNSFIGSPIERREDLRFLRGRGQYVDDLARKDTLYAAILRSSVAHGRIRAIDVSAATALPGVHSVITARDIGNRVPRVPMRLQPLPEFEPFGQPVIAETKVRYVGEAIALVLARTPAPPADALALIDVDIEALPAVPTGTSAEMRVFAASGAGHQPAIKFHGAGDACGVGMRSYVSAAFSAPHGCAYGARGLLAEGMRCAGTNRAGRRQGASTAARSRRSRWVSTKRDRSGERRWLRCAANYRKTSCRWRAPRGRPGEMDGRPPRAPDVHESRAQAECDVGSYTRDGTILARAATLRDVGAYGAPTARGRRAQRRAIHVGALSHPNIDIDVKLQLTNKTPVGTYAGRAASRPISSASASSTVAGIWPRPRRVPPPQPLSAQGECPTRRHHHAVQQGRVRQRDYHATPDLAWSKSAGRKSSGGQLIDGAPRRRAGRT